MDIFDNKKIRESLNDILIDFENKIAETGDSNEGTRALLREFDMTEEDFLKLSSLLQVFYISQGVGMSEGVQLTLILGMILGRQLDQELRHDAGL